ncbi:MAG: phosphoribosylformylglycinamidine synthase, partial [Gammaproteobacteria bacterium]|nr:phosphoribosylformylglycinamidine synthase [Gammaproteobacteria bacterium]
MQYYLLGRKALPTFKAQHLQSELINRLPDIEVVDAHFCYLLETTDDLSEKMKVALSCLLQAQIVPIEAGLNRFWVWPRRGTLSPWSSKATDIIARIGLNEVARLEQGICYQIHQQTPLAIDAVKWRLIADLFYDKLIEEYVVEAKEVNQWFNTPKAAPLATVCWLNLSPAERFAFSVEKGYGFNDATIAAISAEYARLGRDPTDAELMMYASVNSEHCRHHIFKSNWVINGQEQPGTLFSHIQQTYHHHTADVYSAYCDNGAIIGKRSVETIWPRFSDHHYMRHHEDMAMVIKVETHNHPTAIAPFQGAATGSGGEIRDEGATGRGAKPKAGLVGFSVSNLNIPGFHQEWEKAQNTPQNKASALTIMLQGPLGAASFNNEFGRPNTCGYFRSFEQRVEHTEWGYHKPVMLAGGLGSIRESQFNKKALPIGALILVLGGPALRIGLGGGALSSQVSVDENDALEYASVQRANAEMQRRAQEVINSCWALGRDNPILSIHDVGAGGLSNAIPELVYDHKRGAKIELRDIPSADLSLSPLELWCNEAQERYVLVLTENRLSEFSNIAAREQCTFAVVGKVTEIPQLIVYDREHRNNVVDIDLKFLLDTKIPFTRSASRFTQKILALKHNHINLEEATLRVLKHPTVANKSFLITIGDRSVGGLTYRDQMVGPWQVPVADTAVSVSGFYQHSGEAMALGERSPVAIINPAASGRLAVGEAITNIAAAAIEKLSDIKLSANWMAACGIEQEELALWDTVKAVATELCVSLDLTIPVGKDSLSMQTQWQQDGVMHQVISPLTLVISAFAPVHDVRLSLTPQLQITYDDSVLLLIDLGQGRHRLGGSILSEVYNEAGKGETPDVDSPVLLKQFFDVIQKLNQNSQILAYHDRSDGGLFVTLVEMAFAAHTGLTIHLDALGTDPIASLFAEELGAVIQVEKMHLSAVLEQL